MTNGVLYVKIRNMKSLSIKIKFIISLTFIVIASFIFATLPNVNVTASASDSGFFPISQMEYYHLSSPQNVAYSEIYTAVNDNNEKIILFSNQTKEKIATYEIDKTLGQVKIFNDEIMFVSDKSIYRLSLNGDTLTPQNLKDVHEMNIGGNFDYNGEYIIINAEEKTKIYKLDGNVATQVGEEFYSLKDNSVAVNSNNEFFYVTKEGNALNKRDISGNEETVCTLPATESRYDIVANNERVYYLCLNGIYFVNLFDEEPTPIKLSVNSSLYPNYQDYDLGNLNNPISLALKGDNLLVCDSNSVQEFSIEEDKLNFTGFAISEDGTGYNRITANVNYVDSFDDKVLVKDDFKVTIAKEDSSFDMYDRNNFNNLFVNDVPQLVSLGKDSLLVLQNNVLKSVNPINNAETVITEYFEATDITYSVDTFYLATLDGIFTVKDNVLSSDPVYTEQVLSHFTVDIFGEVKTNDYLLETDLFGNVFTYSDSEIKANGKSELSIENLISFTMTFSKKNVYYIIDGQNKLYKTNELTNISIDNFSVPQQFYTSKDTADVDELKIYKAKDNAKIFKTDFSGESFKFIDFAEKEDEYVLVDRITDGKNTLLALTSSQGLILAHEALTEEVELVFTESPKAFYINTSVHAYYRPVLTLKSENRIVLDGEFVKLNRGNLLETNGNGKFTFLGKEFYYATLTVKGKTINVYVPSAFTVLALAEDVETETFTVETVKKCTLYLDSDLVDKVTEIPENTTVKILEKGDKTSLVLVKVNEVEIKGYIENGVIQNTSKIAIRNLVIIIIVSACVCLTLTFFVLRKKK